MSDTIGVVGKACLDLVRGGNSSFVFMNDSVAMKSLMQSAFCSELLRRLKQEGVGLFTKSPII